MVMATEPGTAITLWAVVSAFGGAIIGSVLGGLTSYFLQRKSLAATKALHDLDRTETRKALGYSLLFKMIRVVSSLQQLGKLVTGSLEQAKLKGFAGERWQVVLPVAPLPDAIRFSPEEMALVLSMDSKLFNDIAALDELHNSTVAIFGLYASKRNSILEHLGAEMQGSMGTTWLTEAQKKWLAPRSVELNSLVDRTEQDAREAWQGLERLHNALEKEFNLRHTLQLKRPDEKTKPRTALQEIMEDHGLGPVQQARVKRRLSGTKADE
jgi:hypothetical protein